MMKRVVVAIGSLGRLIGQLLGFFRGGRVLLSGISDAARESSTAIKTSGGTVVLSTASPTLAWRARTFLTKEPETIAWIDELEEGSVLWDVGANVGLYSVYAAVSRNLRVCAFEPSVFNLEFLARNVVKNGVESAVTIVPVALNDSTKVSSFDMSNTTWGGALSTFEHKIGWNGKAIESCFSYLTLGVSADQLVESFGLPFPDALKIDVDGIEHLVLAGASGVLERVGTVLIEVNRDVPEHADGIRQYLEAAGMRLEKSAHSDLIENSNFAVVVNQIWRRSPQGF